MGDITMLMPVEKQKITNPETVGEIVRAILAAETDPDQDREHFYVIGLDGKNNIKYVELISLGTLNRAIVHPRDVFRLAIMRGVRSIILAHNHPSGDPQPSVEDAEITARLREGGEILGIAVLDHVIVGETIYSFQAVGKM